MPIISNERVIFDNLLKNKANFDDNFYARGRRRVLKYVKYVLFWPTIKG
jgi:hypothetical protein